MTSTRGRVLVAMSGGVDSSIAAALLQKDGWDVAGVTFKLFCYADEEAGAKACCGLGGVRDAQSVARHLGISHAVLDFSALFQEKVVEDFVREYGHGRTPNPCVQCNTHVKFAPLLDWGLKSGFERIATGHYARLEEPIIEGRLHPLIRRAKSAAKDQSYVLWGIPPRVLSSTLFPLGGLAKEEVRSLAHAMGLPVWDKGESQDICFVGEEGYAAVVRRQLGPDHPLTRPGEIVDPSDVVLGRHDGIVGYTVGQRRHLGLCGPERRFVLSLEPERNLVRVGPEEGLYRREFRASLLNLFVPRSVLESGPVEVQIRSRHHPVTGSARLTADGMTMEVLCDQPQRAVVPGQSCVIYRDGWLLAGGRIEGPSPEA